MLHLSNWWWKKGILNKNNKKNYGDEDRSVTLMALIWPCWQSENEIHSTNVAIWHISAVLISAFIGCKNFKAVIINHAVCHTFSSSCYLFSLASSFCPHLWVGGSEQQQQEGQRVLVQRVVEGWASNCTQQWCHMMAWPHPALKQQQREKAQWK